MLGGLPIFSQDKNTETYLSPRLCNRLPPHVQPPCSCGAARMRLTMQRHNHAATTYHSFDYSILVPCPCTVSIVREERLRLRHGRGGGVAMAPPPPPAQAVVDATPSVSRGVGSLHAGVVGMAVSPGDSVNSKGGAAGSVARQAEVRHNMFFVGHSGSFAL